MPLAERTFLSLQCVNDQGNPVPMDLLLLKWTSTEGNGIFLLSLPIKVCRGGAILAFPVDQISEAEQLAGRAAREDALLGRSDARGVDCGVQQGCEDQVGQEAQPVPSDHRGLR